MALGCIWLAEFWLMISPLASQRELSWSFRTGRYIFANNSLSMIPAYSKIVANYNVIMNFVAETVVAIMNHVDRLRSWGRLFSLEHLSMNNLSSMAIR